jgi:hypothetical protein
VDRSESPDDAAIAADSWSSRKPSSASAATYPETNVAHPITDCSPQFSASRRALASHPSAAGTLSKLVRYQIEMCTATIAASPYRDSASKAATARSACSRAARKSPSHQQARANPRRASPDSWRSSTAAYASWAARHLPASASAAASSMVVTMATEPWWTDIDALNRSIDRCRAGLVTGTLGP